MGASSGRQGQRSSSSSFSTRHQEAWSWPGSAPHSWHGLESALSRSSSKEGSLERLRARASSKRRCRPFFTGHSRLTSCPASECIARSHAVAGVPERVGYRAAMPPEPWWKSAVVYQIYPRSFADSDGDGVGDLEGIRPPPRPPGVAGRRRHLALAVLPLPHGRLRLRRQRLLRRRPAVRRPSRTSTACWPTPTTAGMRLVIDWVPNHTSSEHPWFVASRSSRDDPKRDWYIWRDPGPDGAPPNNWRQAFRDAPAWTLDPATGQCYLHLFLPEQPDLNWANPEVEAAMHDTLRFWLDRGVDGFRMDVIHAIGKDPALPDDPPEVAAIPHSGLNDTPAHPRAAAPHPRAARRATTATGCRSARCSCSTRPRSRRTSATATSCTWRSTSRRCSTKWRAHRWARSARRRGRPHRAGGLADLGAVEPRRPPPPHPLRLRGRARAAAVLLLGLRGTPFLYAGEELGLEDAEVPRRPGRRSRRAGRLPGADAVGPVAPATAGATGEPWLPWPPDPSAPQRRGAAGGPGVDPPPLPGAARRPEGVAGPPARRPGACSTRPRACSCGSGPPASDRRLVAVNFTDEPVDGARPRRHGRGQQRPGRRGRALLRHPRPRPGGLAPTA